LSFSICHLSFLTFHFVCFYDIEELHVVDTANGKMKNEK